jgi:hypothetical protein
VCSHYFNLGIHETTAAGESILTQTIWKASIRQRQTSAATLIFCWMVGKHFTLRLRIWKVDYGVKKELLRAEMAFG